MRKHTVVGGIALLAWALAAGSGSAQPWWGWAGTAGSPLGLTGEQLMQMQDIVTKQQKEMLPLWFDLQAKYLEIYRLTADPSADPSQLTLKTKEIGELQAGIQTKLLESRNAIRSILTEDQRAFYDQLSLGYGWGRGPCGLGLGAGWWGGGFGGGRGFGRSGWFGGWPAGSWGLGVGTGLASPAMYGLGFGRGRGPCGMGLGRMSPWMGRWLW